MDFKKIIKMFEDDRAEERRMSDIGDQWRLQRQRQGQVGAALANTSGGQFVTKADRLNQAKVDAALGPGFIAGSQKANLALQAKFRQQPPAAETPVPPVPAQTTPGGGPGTQQQLARRLGQNAPYTPPGLQSARMAPGQTSAATTPDATAPATTTTTPATTPTTPDTEIKPDSGFTPAQEKWLGGADRTDPYILSRMRSAVPGAATGSGENLGKGSYFTPQKPAADDKTQAVPMDTGMEMKPLNTQSGNNTTQNFAEEELQDLEEELNEMLRLSGIMLSEKAVSKQQQKFMGMVHAMQKGEKVKGASPELKKVAKTMGKKDAKDFASTKHKGLPKKVTEGLNLMLDEEGHTLNHIVNKYKHEVKSFLDDADMSENLYDALYDYYLDRGDMPYGVAKAREGDPYQWVANKFYSDIGGSMNEAHMYEVAADDTLNELAKLAGLTHEGIGDDIAYGAGKFVGKVEKGASDLANSFKSGRVVGSEIDKEILPKMQPLQLPTTRSPSPSERHRTINQPTPGLKGELSECDDMGMSSNDRLNVSTNMSSDGTKSVNISAQGEKAEELLAMLKLAGMGGSDRPAMVMIDRGEKMMDEERETEYANTPEEEYQTVASITRQGNDLNREKKQFANMPKAGDNPIATDYMLDEELSALLDSVLVKEVDPRRPPGDTGIADIYTAGKGIAPPSPDEGPVGLSKADIPKNMKPMPLPKTAPEPSMKNMPLPKGQEPRTKPM
jgi:hypothetical protein